MASNTLRTVPINAQEAARVLSPEEYMVESIFHGTYQGNPIDQFTDRQLGEIAMRQFGTLNDDATGDEGASPIGAAIQRRSGGVLQFNNRSYKPSQTILDMIASTGETDLNALGAAIRAENPGDILSFTPPTDKNSKSRITRRRIDATEFGDQRRNIRTGLDAQRSTFGGLDPQRALDTPADFKKYAASLVRQRRAVGSLLGVPDDIDTFG